MAIIDQSATHLLVIFEIITRYGSIIIAIIQGMILDSGVNKNSEPARPIGMYGMRRLRVAGK